MIALTQMHQRLEKLLPFLHCQRSTQEQRPLWIKSNLMVKNVVTPTLIATIHPYSTNEYETIKLTNRQYPRQIIVTSRHKIQPHLTQINQYHILNHPPKSPFRLSFLHGLSPIKGNTLRILTHSHQRKSKISLSLQRIVIQPYQSFSDANC